MTSGVVESAGEGVLARGAGRSARRRGGGVTVQEVSPGGPQARS
jgi:hypothetical protein